MKNSFTQIHQNTSMKEYLTIAIVSLLTILTPIKPFIVMVIMFVVSDTILAIVGSIKTLGISSFKSNKLFNLAIKIFFYCGAIVVTYLVDKYIFEGSILGIKLLLTKVVTLLWCYIEIKSLDETSMKFFNNKSVWVLLKEMFAKGKELKKDLSDIIDDKDKDKEEPKE